MGLIGVEKETHRESGSPTSRFQTGCKNDLSFGELFSGPGGLALGLKRSGFRPVWAIDADPWTCKTYERNLGKNAFCARVESVDFKKLPSVGGLAFGFPCNDFSMIGERRGTDGYFGSLYLQAVRALNQLRPNWFLAENVPGLISTTGHVLLDKFCRAGRGYAVSVHLFKFEDYGVPQRRHRIIALGLRTDWRLCFLPPAPTHSKPVTCAEALRRVERTAHNNERTTHSPKVVELLSRIPEGENAWHPDIPARLRLRVKGCKLSLIYRRLKRDEPSYTVTGSGGGGTQMYHFSEPRALTNRERARLQTFPDDFFFEGPKEAVRRQIGMAVPPAGAEAIGRALRATLSGTKRHHVSPSLGVLHPSTPARV